MEIKVDVITSTKSLLRQIKIHKIERSWIIKIIKISEAWKAEQVKKLINRINQEARKRSLDALQYYFS